MSGSTPPRRADGPLRPGEGARVSPLGPLRVRDGRHEAAVPSLPTEPPTRTRGLAVSWDRGARAADGRGPRALDHRERRRQLGRSIQPRARRPHRVRDRRRQGAPKGRPGDPQSVSARHPQDGPRPARRGESQRHGPRRARRAGRRAVRLRAGESWRRVAGALQSDFRRMSRSCRADERIGRALIRQSRARGHTRAALEGSSSASAGSDWNESVSCTPSGKAI
jgi:hypothetical protein